MYITDDSIHLERMMAASFECETYNYAHFRTHWNGVVQSFSLSLMRSWICAAIWYIKWSTVKVNAKQSKMFELLSSHFVHSIWCWCACVLLCVCARIVKSSCRNFISAMAALSNELCKHSSREKWKGENEFPLKRRTATLYPSIQLCPLWLFVFLFFTTLFARLMLYACTLF